MNLAEELLRPVQPLYAPRVPAYKRAKYPRDKDGKRYCGCCWKWKPLDKFPPKDATRLHRECKTCRNRKREAY